jgi:hypothetical protein
LRYPYLQISTSADLDLTPILALADSLRQQKEPEQEKMP